MAKKPGKKPPSGLVLGLLDAAERNGLSMGGLFLIAIGLYGGQYAKLFPEDLQNAAGIFCLVVAGCGALAFVFQMLLAWRTKLMQPG